MTLVVDANAAAWAAASGGIDAHFGGDLAAPPIMWSEVLSFMREGVFRRELSRDAALELIARVEAAPIVAHSGPEIRRAAWEIADQLGTAKTYDAEYLAVARALGARVVTLDLRLRRGADRLGLVITPNELLT